ncbi:MAG: hypothetical protein LC723_06135 [Actinobacteria bacterium]|nr:hypothetical protein [Actinomycetota bacterium]
MIDLEEFDSVVHADVVHQLLHLVTSADGEPLKASELTDFEEIQAAVVRQELELEQAVGRLWEFYRHDRATRQNWTVWLMDESGAGLIGPDSSNLGNYLGAIFFEAEPQQEVDRSYFSVQYTLYERGTLRLIEAYPSVDSAVQSELADAAASVGVELLPRDYQYSSGILPVREGRALAAALAMAGAVCTSS